MLGKITQKKIENMEVTGKDGDVSLALARDISKEELVIYILYLKIIFTYSSFM